MSKYSEETLAALLKSAQRWETRHPDDLGGWRECPLCSTHRTVTTSRDGGEVICDGCPIRDKTGDYGCDGSPYEAFFQATNEDDATERARTFAKWLHELYEEVK